MQWIRCVVAQQALLLEDLHLGDADLGHPLRDRVEVLRPVHEVEQDRLGAAEGLDVVPEGEGEVVAVPAEAALHPDPEDAVEALVGPGLDRGGRRGVQRHVRDAELLDVLGVREPVL